MSVRLGEMLVQRGKITSSQLQEALVAQNVFGGRLGTNLVELGFVTETDLARLLSAQKNIPCADLEEFSNIKPKVLETIPEALAAKYSVVPLSVENKTVRLAMADPANFSFLDDIAFASGYKIKPVVAPEVLIISALEKYYNIQRSLRYLRLPKAIEEMIRASRKEEAKPDNISPQTSSGSGKESAKALPPEKGIRSFSIKDAAQSLADIRTLPELLEVVRRYTAQDFRISAVFAFKGEAAVGLTHVGCPVNHQDFGKISFPFRHSALFLQVVESKSAYQGKLPNTPTDRWLGEALGIAASERVVCIPVLVNQLPVCMLVNAGPKSEDLINLAVSYGQFSSKLGYAFEILFLRNKISDLSELS